MLSVIPKMSENLSRIRQLDEAAINRIAAGEVVERPASAVKELVENALDAGATNIRVDISDGGKSLIRVIDNGRGMDPIDLPMALHRHATSKIDGSDLLNIQSFGFRGEALPSLGAVGRLTVTSRADGFDASQITVSGGDVSSIKPAVLISGTQVELRDLFYATPARLKFMRTDRAEAQGVSEVIKRLAMACPAVGFELNNLSGGKVQCVFKVSAEANRSTDAINRRISQILGRSFSENAVCVNAERQQFRLIGFAALPTFSRGSAVMQYLFVNGRPVRDKILNGALRAAYSDFLMKGRHPAAVLFISCDPDMVDVNVHPAKSEVRFRQPGVLSGLIISALRHRLAETGHKSSSTISNAILGEVEASENAPAFKYQIDMKRMAEKAVSYNKFTPQFSETRTISARIDDIEEEKYVLNGDQSEQFPLGAARAQLHENYIISQTLDGLVIVDQHAAHERILYEKLKSQMRETGVAAQALLIPEIIDLSPEDCAQITSVAESLENLGFAIESFGAGSIAVRSVPAILGDTNAKALLMDLLDELNDQDQMQTIQDKIEAILKRISCHGSVRSGRRLRGEEMNALLREMEATPHSGQCNHGRPTYVELKLSDIERLFGRR